MINNLMKEIVVWQKTPDDRAFIFDNEEGLPYILSDGTYHLAIVKDGKIIDSVPMNIIKPAIYGEFDPLHSHRIDFWDDGSFRLIANHSIVKKIMHNRVLFRKAGWSNELILLTLMLFVESSDTSTPESEFLNYIGNKNLNVYRYPYIVAQAAAAYEFYLNFFASKKHCGIKVKSNTDSDVRDDAIRLALYISLLNPCVDGPWKSLYNQQGVRGNNSSSCELTIMLEGLKSRMHDELSNLYNVKNGLTGLEFGFIGPDDDKYNPVWRKYDALIIVTDMLEEEHQANIEGRNVQINAIHAAKVKLTAMGISCGTNTIEKEWTHFVATAWGVTPSQVVSAAKALKRRESQEQK
jgi:hypothetical protein